MTTQRVNSDALNLRGEPNVVDGNILAVLSKGHEVTVLGESDNAGWVEVEVSLGGGTRRGFVASRLLRDPVSDDKEKLVGAAVAEWIRFDKGAGKEHRDPYYRYVGEMWEGIGMNLDGKDRDVPWSAAFISFVLRSAGTAYSGFKFAAAHARYIHDSIKKRQSAVDSPFWGFRLHEHKVALGDLVCQWRTTPRTYDQAAVQDSFFSHCDVVVELSGGAVRALGGNNSHTVGFKTYARNEDGFLKAENKVFAVLRNNR